MPLALVLDAGVMMQMADLVVERHTIAGLLRGEKRSRLGREIFSEGQLESARSSDKKDNLLSANTRMVLCMHQTEVDMQTTSNYTRYHHTGLLRGRLE
jgi:hypothetical protein